VDSVLTSARTRSVSARSLPPPEAATWVKRMDQEELSELYKKVRVSLQTDHRTTLREMSSRARIERHYIELACRSHGTTFRQLKEAARCSVAVQQLKERLSDPIKTIAFDLGFSSSAAFCRFIKKATGRTPAQLRDGEIPASKIVESVRQKR
jgi:AraC-like DNA-binding protein